MSLVTVSEARNMREHIDVEGTVKSILEPRLVNLKNGDVAYVADAQLFDRFGNYIKVSFWNEDIKKVRNNLKIRIRNGYTRIFKGDTCLYKSKSGFIDILDFNPNVIFDDIEKFLKYNKNSLSFEKYYNYVENVDSDEYLGTKKSIYLSIIDAFCVVESARKAGTKQNQAELAAIHFLHNMITLSPVSIRQTLKLFRIDIPLERILRISTEWNEKRSMPDFQKTYGKLRHLEKPRQTHIFGYTDNDLPNEITVDENLELGDLDKPLCERSCLEFNRKYKGYHTFYDKPWR